VVYEIIRRQTTFWDLRCDDGRIERIHFLGKEEWRFVDARCAAFVILDEHPLLIDYRWEWARVYLAGQALCCKRVVRRLERDIEARVGPWRSPSDYLNSFGAERLLRAGEGMLLSGPLPIVEVCESVLRRSRVAFTRLPGPAARWPRQALVAGGNFVVAGAFRVEGSARRSRVDS
jgi:hypothetical protein